MGEVKYCIWLNQRGGGDGGVRGDVDVDLNENVGGDEAGGFFLRGSP